MAIDRELARKSSNALPLRTQAPVASWEDRHTYATGLDYNHPHAVGILIAAIEALPGIDFVHIDLDEEYHATGHAAYYAEAQRRERNSWKRSSVDFVWGSTRGEALARLLVQLTEDQR